MKMSRRDMDKHERAMEYLKRGLPVRISDDPNPAWYKITDFFRDYQPSVNTYISGIGAFFTPEKVAVNMAMDSGPNNCKCLDLCAGIGSLTYWMNEYGYQSKFTLIERQQDYVDVGSRLVKGDNITWHCEDMGNLEFMKSLGQFDVAFSNPPYGTNALKGSILKTAKFRDQDIYGALEIMVRMAYTVLLILPVSHYEKYQENPNGSQIGKFLELFPGLEVNEVEDMVGFDIETDDDDKFEEDKFKDAKITVTTLEFTHIDCFHGKPFGWDDLCVDGKFLTAAPEIKGKKPAKKKVNTEEQELIKVPKPVKEQKPPKEPKPAAPKRKKQKPPQLVLF